MKRVNIYRSLVLAGAMALAFGCGPSEQRTSSELPPVFPDYSSVTIPVNIAPLNFDAAVPCSKIEVTVDNGRSQVKFSGRKGIRIPIRKWRRMVGGADSLRFSVGITADGVRTDYAPFTVHVSRDSIDYGICYRRIDPGYELYAGMGIYYRPLSEWREHTLMENSLIAGSCLNCHSFAKTDVGNMQFHIRGNGGGTILSQNGDVRLLDTKTDQTGVSCVYPYWHPSGRYIAYSVNDIRQTFHSDPKQILEVYDLRSDVVIYDTRTGELNIYPILADTARFETFPAFSADGRKLYFCSADASTLPVLTDIKYSLCSIDFDPETGEVGQKIDTLWDGNGGSVSFPRPSYDGRWLLVTRSDFGNFTIWHKDADLWLIDLQSGELRPVDEINSDDTESYHSWSSTSRWVVFSSRRIDGLHTRPYIAHVDTAGRFGKPFLLPQRDPAYYDELMQSYNIPEFISGPIDLSPDEITGARHEKVTARER